jgi:hypothetical protein
MHSFAAMVLMGAALMGQPGGVTESELPPPGSPRVVEQAPRQIVPERPATTPSDAAPVARSEPAPPRAEERGPAGSRPVAAFWFVIQGS